MTGPLLVIDADALMHRAYRSMPPVKRLGGRPVNALLGFTPRASARRPRRSCCRPTVIWKGCSKRDPI